MDAVVVKRLTAKHWAEVRNADPYDPRLRLRNDAYRKLDAEAVAAGYEPGQGAFRPWFCRHVMSLIALTADSDALAVLDRLNEIAEAQKEVAALTEALREWLAVTELIARIRGELTHDMC
jgi:hypothetical protein